MRWFIIILSVAWFPHSLERIHALGYDFPIFYEAGRGHLMAGWVYSNHLAFVFTPLTLLPLDTAFALWYLLSVSVWVSLAKRSWLFGMFATYPMLLSLELGASAPIFAWLCLFPFGAFVAMLFKPYLVVFVLLHAVSFTISEHRKRCGVMAESLLQNQSNLHHPPLGGNLFTSTE